MTAIFELCRAAGIFAGGFILGRLSGRNRAVWCCRCGDEDSDGFHCKAKMPPDDEGQDANESGCQHQWRICRGEGRVIQCVKCGENREL